MDQLTSPQNLEYLEAGFEVSKLLAHAGCRMDAPAFVITWGQVAEVLAHTLADYGLSPERLDETVLLELAQSAQKALENDETLTWRDAVRLNATAHPIISELFEPLDREDDEGPLTEQYENSVRLGDDEAYWADGGASADMFDDF
jgi:hypothetical protein